MKLYRNLKPDETLQMGDQRMDGNGGWKPAEAVWIGQPVPEDLMGCFRRPVDAVSRKDHERPRYLLFAGDDDSLPGAWEIKGGFSTLDECRQHIRMSAERNRGPYKWWNVYDTVNQSVKGESLLPVDFEEVE